MARTLEIIGIVLVLAALTATIGLLAGLVWAVIGLAGVGGAVLFVAAQFIDRARAVSEAAE